MKIRQGFVSNSSSSSFIIPLPSGTMVTEENVHVQLYGELKPIEFEYEFDWNKEQINPVTSTDVVKSIVEQIATCSDKEQAVIDAISLDYAELDNIWKRGDRNKENDYEIMIEELKQKKYEQLKERFRGFDLYAVEFSDDSSWGCEVEHGPALRRTRTVKFNHH